MHYRPVIWMKGTSMLAEEYKRAFEEATIRITDLASGDGDLPIPHVADWTLADAVIHTGLVFSFVSQSVSQGSPIGDGGVAPWANDRSNRPETKELADWFSTAAHEMIEVIWKLDPDEEVWTSSRDTNKARFWMRRMTQEAVVHRWDIEAATGSQTAIDSRIAVDGINEFYDFFVAERLPAAFAGTGTVHLHATDAPGEWMISRNENGVEVESAHGKGDVAARGLASDLLLFVWNRVDYTTLETFGDTDLLDEHQGAFRI